MDVKIEGLQDINLMLDEIADESKLESLVLNAALRVERDARKKAPKRTGALRRSIESRVENDGSTISGVVFTPLEYAPYVCYGSGLFAETQGRQTPWAYQDEKTGEWIWTKGQHPKPFLRPALNENREKIINSIKRGLTK